MLRPFGAALLVAFVGGVLGVAFGSLSLEAADWTTPAYRRGSVVYLALVTVSWALLLGVAFSPVCGFPPPRPAIAVLLWQGGLRGATATALALGVTAVAWALLGLGGPAKPGTAALLGAPSEWLSGMGPPVLLGLVTGGLFAVMVGRSP